MTIYNRFSKKVIYESEKTPLRGANLREADLRDANLREADLRDADLRGADLRDADLRDANLSRANLRDADLREADLRDANLSRANLREANLSSADLSGADLRDANLIDADLIQIMLPFFAVIVQKEYTRVGCRCFSNKAWRDMQAYEISKMDTNALKFWNDYKQIIFKAMDILNKKN